MVRVRLRILEGANLQTRDEFGKLLAGADFKVERTHPLKENCDTLLYTLQNTGSSTGVVCCCCCLAPINPLGYSHKLHVCSQSEAAGVFVHILIAKTTLYLCVSIKYSVEIRYAPPGATNPRQKLFACVHYFCCDKTPAAAHCVILCSSLEFQHAYIPLFILLRIKCLSPRNTKQRISIMPIIIMNLVKLRRGKSAPVLSSTQHLPLRLSISFAPMHTIVIYIPCMNAHIQKSLAAKLALPLAS